MADQDRQDSFDSNHRGWLFQSQFSSIVWPIDFNDRSNGVGLDPALWTFWMNALGLIGFALLPGTMNVFAPTLKSGIIPVPFLLGATIADHRLDLDLISIRTDAESLALLDDFLDVFPGCRAGQ